MRNTDICQAQLTSLGLDPTLEKSETKADTKNVCHIELPDGSNTGKIGNQNRQIV